MIEFDVVLIGGGLSSLVCGIKLQKAGLRCMIVSAGQNALHFSSGAFGLLGRMPGGEAVSDPMAAIPSLPAGHPYSKIGAEKVSEYAASTPGFFASCGVSLRPAGENGNGFRLTGLGTLKPAWLVMDEVATLASKDEKIGRKALIVNFSGFLDFNTAFIAESLEKRGVECRIESVKMDEVEILRKNPSEMRSVNIARVMDNEKNWKQFGHLVQELIDGEDVVVLPEVFGLENPSVPGWISQMISSKVLFLGTTPPSVPGIRTQKLLKKAFENAGGTFQAGDEALDPCFEDGRVKSIRTANLGSVRIGAKAFVLASGNLFGKGLVSSPDKVVEPVFGLDVDCPSQRGDWYSEDFFAGQKFTAFGVKSDGKFHPYKDGVAVPNLYVIGSEVGGCSPLEEGSGAGVAVVTAFSAADSILENK
jgi:glycerol-3-phosphate dehydrogenase subunit B